MPIDTETLSGKSLGDILRNDVASDPSRFCNTVLVERLPFSLTYTANLQRRDRAVLFYDNLVVAAEYFCAFIEEGIRRQEVTCLTGLEPARYHALFEQIGIKVAELENCGYLRNLTTDDSHKELEQFERSLTSVDSDDPLRTGLEDGPAGIRLIHIQNPRGQQKTSLEELSEVEHRTHGLFSFPNTSICCYDTKLVLEDAPPSFFKEALKTHDHCVFQGIAMPTSKLLSSLTNQIYPKIRSA